MLAKCTKFNQKINHFQSACLLAGILYYTVIFHTKCLIDLCVLSMKFWKGNNN